MGLNDQVRAFGNRGGRKSIFKEGVRNMALSGKDSPKVFRILPAFDPRNPDPSVSYLPCLDPSGALTEFARVIYISRFIGHGKGGAGSRQDILSLRTFDPQAFDPLEHLFGYIRQDAASWGYLIKDQGEKNDPNRVMKAFDRPQPCLIANIVDMAQSTMGAIIGMFPQSAATALIDHKQGLVFQPNVMVGIEEMIAKNYINAYANGDITDPNKGLVFVCEKGSNKGEMSSYSLRFHVDNQGRVLRHTCDRATMASRYDMTHPETFLAVPTPEETITLLVQLLNGRSPAGYHEHALLRLAFPQYSSIIPEPTPAPAAGATVGYMPPAGLGFPPSAGTIPGAVPGNGYVPPAPMAGGFVTPPTTPALQPIPAYVPPANSGMVPVNPAGRASVSPEVKSAVEAAVAGIPPAHIAPPQVPQPQAPAAPVPEPVVPGDTIPGGPWDQNAFLNRIRGQ